MAGQQCSVMPQTTAHTLHFQYTNITAAKRPAQHFLHTAYHTPNSATLKSSSLALQAAKTCSLLNLLACKLPTRPPSCAATTQLLMLLHSQPCCHP